MSDEPTRHERGPSTRGIHAGRRPGAGDPAVVTPIHQSATFVPDERDLALLEAGRIHEAHFYTRCGNPTVSAVERKLAELEGAVPAPEGGARLFASGNAAMHATLMACALPAGHVVAAEKLYGGTRGVLDDCLVPAGGAVTYADAEDEGALDEAWRPETRVLLCESIANPTLEVADLPRLARRAHERGALLVVDATYASPALQRPLELGADVVVHSATKYIGGHSDQVAGVATARGEVLERLTAWRNNAGGCLDPHGAFLVDRGLKTLALRMEAHGRGALALASALAEHPRVRRVRYPGLEDFEHHLRARELLAGFGGMVFLELEADDAAVTRCLAHLELGLAAPSLGGVETLVSQPALSSHAAMSADERAALGIPPGSLRISVGLEDPADLIADFRRALDQLG